MGAPRQARGSDDARLSQVSKPVAQALQTGKDGARHKIVAIRTIILP